MKEESRGSKEQPKGSKDELRGSKDNLKGSKDDLRGSRDELRGSKDDLRGSKDDLRSDEEKKAEEKKLKAGLRGSRDILPVRSNSRQALVVLEPTKRTKQPKVQIAEVPAGPDILPVPGGIECCLTGRTPRGLLVLHRRGVAVVQAGRSGRYREELP